MGISVNLVAKLFHNVAKRVWNIGPFGTRQMTIESDFIREIKNRISYSHLIGMLILTTWHGIYLIAFRIFYFSSFPVF